MNIVLTGFMGTGKSEVGKALANRLKWSFFDIDAMIEAEIGVGISEIFRRHGEAHFRELESRTVKLVAVLDRVVIACGGGVVLRKDNLDELERSGIVVCLTASPETVLERTRDSGRPLLAGNDPLGQIKKLLGERSAYYARCNLTVDTTGRSVAEIMDDILGNPVVAGGLAG